MKKRIIVSKTIIISSFFIFVVMLILNSLTPLCTDDYVYSYSFAEGKIDEYIKIDNILYIFPSMYNHAFTQNGRLVAHFFTQFFLMYSKILFNIINSLVFVTLVVLIYRMCVIHKKKNNILVWFVAALIWYFVPYLGQTCMWLDGSCNYLWGECFLY